MFISAPHIIFSVRGKAAMSSADWPPGSFKDAISDIYFNRISVGYIIASYITIPSFCYLVWVS
jgi:hypothetical protein